jgi:hypothetical protein
MIEYLCRSYTLLHIAKHWITYRPVLIHGLPVENDVA